MVTLEQIKLLDSKITRALGFISRLTEENARLKKEIVELTETAAKLQEENNRVEEEFTSALEKLNKFEDAIEQSLSSIKAGLNPAQNTIFRQENAPPVPDPPVTPVPPAALEVKLSAPETELPTAPLAYTIDEEGDTEDADTVEEPEENIEEGMEEDPSDDTENTEEESETSDSDGEELDIF